MGRRRARRTLVAVLLAAVVLVLAACGGAEREAPQAPAQAPAASPLRQAPAPDPPAPSAEPPAPAEPVQPAPAGEVRREVVAEGLSRPVLVASPPGDGSATGSVDDRLFVVEQTGTIRILADDGTVSDPVLDLSQDVSTGNEQGLLGLAFDPGFEENRRLYVNFTALDGTTYVSRFLLPEGSDVVDPDSRVDLLVEPQPYPNHNGGHLAFGPDGLLYVGLGDGGAGGDPENRAQDPDQLLGKLLRLDVAGEEGYAIPPDNPFASGGGRPEIWALGLRNPWRFSFDPVTGDLWIGDVGQSQVEEVDRVPGAGPPGTNYGWRLFEGTRPFEGGGDEPAGYVPPVFEYTHDVGCSVTGGVVVRDPALPALAGQYVVGDYCSGTIWAIDAAAPDAGARDVTELVGGPVEELSSFGVDADGRVYLIQLSGTISRLTQSS